MRTPVHTTVGTVALAFLAASCGSSGETAKPTASPSKVRSTTRPACLMGDEGKVVWEGDSQVILLGGGSKGVLLAPQSSGDACGWSEEMHRLAKKGYNVAAVTYEQDKPRSLPAALKALRAAGATKVVMMGASAGGGLVLDKAAALVPPPEGVIGVSPVRLWPEQPGVAQYKGPVLLMTAKDDSTSLPDDVKKLGEPHPGGVTLKVYKGQNHGYGLLSMRDEAKAEVDGFLKRHLG